MANKNKIIALDVGDAWIGTAYTDFSHTFVFPGETWRTHEFKQKFTAYITLHKIQIAVIGLPLTLQGKKSEQTNKIETWIEQAKINFPSIAFHIQDERLSSKFAQNIINQNNNKNKHSNHSIAACIILENYIQLNKNK